LAGDQFAFATIGQLTPRKGQLETIRAFHRVSQRTAKALLLIVGTAIFEHDQKYFELLKKEVAELGLQERIFFLGYARRCECSARRLRRGYRQLAPRAFGLVALEALAAGNQLSRHRWTAFPN